MQSVWKNILVLHRKTRLIYVYIYIIYIIYISQKISWRKISLQVPTQTPYICFSLWMTIWPFFKKKKIIILPTFFSASAFFFPSVPPSFHFHSLSLVSGSNWEEGHSSIISLGTYRHISHCSRQHKKWALYLIPRNDCWHQRPADKYWNFWKNVVLLKMLTTCQAECLLTYMWHWGNTDFTSPDCHSGKVKKVA